MSRFYITTTLPYVNAAPHLGFALEAVRADALARYHELLGEEVYFNTGTDEHGLKLARKAEEENLSPQAYVDKQVKHFLDFNEALHIKPIRFIRTTDADHVKAAQEFWKRCAENHGPDGPDIYKDKYQAKYCVGCELEKTDSELEDGRCPLHPKEELELIDEENYFFRFSRYGEALLELYKSNPQFVIPESRLNEIKNLIGEGLRDFSISRPKEKVSWGVPVPGDEAHVMYVWFDALVNYISTLGWPENEEQFKNFWPGVQIAGKDNLRQQSAMWQAMLLSAKLSPAKQIIIHGFVTSGGEKMSKSRGNVVDPQEIVKEYGVDALRYWILREANDFEDSDFTEEKFKESYNAHLANGLGNLASRITKMFVDYEVIFEKDITFQDLMNGDHAAKEREYWDAGEVSKFVDFIWDRIADTEKKIQETQPFKVYKEDPQKAGEIVAGLVNELQGIAVFLQPILPHTSSEILSAIKQNRVIKPLFPRK